MPIVTFKSNGDKETGNTSSAIAIATYMSIEHNMKTLLISTGLNDVDIRESFWNDFDKKSSNGKTVMQNGIEGLSRMITSSKIEPRIIKDYTKVVLTGGRFDVLLGYRGEEKQYKEIQRNYRQVILVASQYYDMIIVDLDRKIDLDIQEKIIEISDIMVLTTRQKVKEMMELKQYTEQNQFMNDINTLVAIGRYDDYLKCNIKNATRNIFKKRNNINVIPYNSKFYEAMQEGTVFDLFYKILTLKNKKDYCYFFAQEVKRLAEDIILRWEEVRLKKHG